jgi:hypothetical protein
MKILGPSDTGKGILVEWDAGIINPNEPRNQNIIRESYGQLEHSKPFEFYATLQKWGVPNRNGRVYPEKILRRESDKYQDAIKRGMSISELNHPESSLIDLDRVSHLITEMWWEGNILMGKIKLLTTPCFDLVSSPSTPGAYLYLNKEDRPRYEEKLAENDNTSVSGGGGLEKSVDLMKRLSDYLGK